MDFLEKQLNSIPPALRRYGETKALVEAAAKEPHGIYIRRGAFEDSGSAILVCAGEPADVDAVIEFGERLKGKYVKTSQITGREYVIQQPEEQKTKMKITKIGYGIELTEPYSGISERVYMEADIDNSDRQSLNRSFRELKEETRAKLSDQLNCNVAIEKIKALEEQTKYHQETLQALRLQLNKLQRVWSAIESLFGKFVGGDRPTGEPELYKAEPTEQQQH